MARWLAAELVRARPEAPGARTLTLRIPGWPGHLPGQHVDVRLTAPDGYHAERSYSLAAPAAGDLVQLTVQRVPGGEVSPYLVDTLPLGAFIEIRGPVGGWFVWEPSESPVFLVGGGAGIVPLMAMVRAHRGAGCAAPLRLIYSVREPGGRYYRDELDQPGEGRTRVDLLYTRRAPAGFPRPVGRLTAADLADHTGPPSSGVTCYVCGPTGFVEAAAELLVGAGYAPGVVRTERFGPSGG
ncbi:ferredoxin reductase [Nocardia sp. NBC_00416]|uniref:ferredoxin reductase n=1 Tax=Nocardia sp. NBC_00416 TaxID=2975991 RepID=UPI002E1A61B2